METLRFIDGDSHILEPERIWQDYLEKIPASNQRPCPMDQRVHAQWVGRSARQHPRKFLEFRVGT
jgi:hypothetical protein